MEKTNSSPCLTDLDSSLTNRMSISKCKIVHGGDDDNNDNDNDEDDDNDNNVYYCNYAIYDC